MRIFKIKVLRLGMLLAFPAIAAWICRGSEVATSSSEVRPISFTTDAAHAESVVRLPVEIIAKGNAPHWIYVNIASNSVPEPGSMSLFGLTGLLLVLRRERS